MNGTTKSTLLSEVLPKLGTETPYFSLATLKRRLDALGVTVVESTCRQYVSEALATGITHDAGRGWYSRIADPFSLDVRPVRRTISRINKAFPLLSFSCWSTELVNPYMHHLLSRFVTFVHTDADLIPSDFEELRGWKGYHLYANPSSAEAERIRVEEKTIVIRPEMSEAPVSADPHVAPIEKLLVDLAVEAEKLPIMGKGEFQDMAWRAVTSGRISMATLIRYARRCRRKPEDVFGSNRLTNGTNP